MSRGYSGGAAPVACADSFNGTWKDGAGQQQTIPQEAFVAVSATQCKYDAGGISFGGSLTSDGKIHWMDGDVWVRVGEPPKKDAAFGFEGPWKDDDGEVFTVPCEGFTALSEKKCKREYGGLAFGGSLQADGTILWQDGSKSVRLGPAPAIAVAAADAIHEKLPMDPVFDSPNGPDTWINPFESLGKAEASCLSPPAFKQWHESTFDCYQSEGDKDPAISAVQSGDIAQVAQLFQEPKDLLRLEIPSVDDDYMTIVQYAFEGLNVDILKHLFKVSPYYFMQQLTLRTGGIENRTPLQSALCAGSQGSTERLLEVVKWLCRAGIMTDTVFAHCSTISAWGCADGECYKVPRDIQYYRRPEKWTSALAVAQSMDAPGMSAVVAELERWDKLPAAEKRPLTIKQCAEVLAAAAFGSDEED